MTEIFNILLIPFIMCMTFGAYYLGRRHMAEDLIDQYLIIEKDGKYYPYQSLSKTLWTHDPDDLP